LSLRTWPIRGDEGRRIVITGTYADGGTGERRFRQSLAQKQLEQREHICAAAPIGLGVADSALRVVQGNEVLARVDGLSAAATPAFPGVQRDWQVGAYPQKHPDGVLSITVVIAASPSASDGVRN